MASSLKKLVLLFLLLQLVSMFRAAPNPLGTEQVARSFFTSYGDDVALSGHGSYLVFASFLMGTQLTPVCSIYMPFAGFVSYPFFLKLIQDEEDPDQLPTIEETFEGDIVLRNLTDPSLADAHLADPDLLWPRGMVEYKFYLTFPPKHQTSVREAMDYITSRTPCVTFVPANNNSINYVTIVSSGSKCASELGMKGGRQMLWLNSGCFRNKLLIPVHELLHTLGFRGVIDGMKTKI